MKEEIREPQTSRRHRQRWAMLGVVALLVITGWYYLRPSSALQLDHTSTSSAPPRAHPHSPIRIRADAQDLNSHPDRSTPSAVKLPLVIQKVLDDNPHLSGYYRLAQKILPTGDERNTLRGMLSNPELIRTIKEDLLANHESIFSKDAEAKRMVAVEFLTDAVAWEDNPAMNSVMEAIESVIFAANISPEAPEDLAQSLAGDKMEIYTQMLHSSPARAAVIADRARGREVEALLTYSKDWYERQTRAMKAAELH